MKIGKIAVVLAAVFAVALGTAQAAYVTIGDAGNAADDNGYGAVDYEYQISTTEVSNDDWESAFEGTTSGNNLPRNYSSAYDAMEYANKLTENAGGTAYYITEDGGDTYSPGDLSHDEYAAANGLTYFVPTEDEWYKAAYYSLEDDQYYDYANGTDTAPTKGTIDPAQDGWNYDPHDGSTRIDPQDVGFSPLEQNGTYDMMGNVHEWQEDTTGVWRGGSYSTDDMSSSYRFSGHSASAAYKANGFRVVAIPEPVSGELFVLVVGLLWFARRRARA